MCHVSESEIILAVNASNLFADSQFDYVWYDSNGNWLDNTTDGTYTLTNPNPGSYYCDVSDGSQSQRVWFYVVEGAFAQASGDSDYWVRPNKQVTLRVAAWNQEHDITYQWYEIDENNESSAINDATEATYTCIVDHYKKMLCHVEGTGISNDVEFRVWVSNSFSVGNTGTSKVVVIPTGGSAQIITDVSSTYDKHLAISWEKDGVIIPGEESNTLTVTEAGVYTFNAADQYGNVYGDRYWCLEEQPELVAEGQYAVGPTNGGTEIYQFIPSQTGVYMIESEGGYEIYREGSTWTFLYMGYENIENGLDGGTIYYIVMDSPSDSFRYTLILPEQAEYTITLQQGQNYRIPELYVNGYGYTVENSTSDNESVVYNDGYDFETLSAGTANLTVNYTSEMQRIYHITVVNTSAFTLPDQLQTIEEDAFDGDTGIRFIRLGSNVQTVKSGAFANTGDITVIVENGNTTFENGVFTNANPLIICAAESNVAWYCNTNRIPYLYK